MATSGGQSGGQLTGWRVRAVFTDASGGDLSIDAPSEALEARRAMIAPNPWTWLRQVHGECWQWTASAYHPYPGFHAPPGAIGEYNGKFMSNQMVLRGGCALTSPGHARTTYRNFFPHAARWAVSGVRLADGGAPQLGGQR